MKPQQQKRRSRRPQQKRQRKPRQKKKGSRGKSQQAMMAAQDLQGFAEMLLENDKIEEGEGVEDQFWGFFSRDAALTFLDASERDHLLRSFDDVTLAELMTKFPHEFQGEDEVRITQGRAAARIRLNRAVGRGSMNERTMLSTQIQQNKREDNRRSPSGGIMSKAKSAVGLGDGGGRR